MLEWVLIWNLQRNQKVILYCGIPEEKKIVKILQGETY